MAYFEDLSAYRYIGGPDSDVLNVGWLGEGRPFQIGDTSHAFQDALTDLCNKNAINLCLGHHACEICPDASWHDPYYSDMGNGEIWVRDAANTWYAAPRLINHYVQKHRYCPPHAFIEAVINPSEIKKDEWFDISEDQQDRPGRDHNIATSASEKSGWKSGLKTE